MDDAPGSAANEARATFAEKLVWLREMRGLSQSGLGREMNRTGEKVSQKSISNIQNQVHASQLDNFAAIAAHFDVPLWVMFIPGLQKEMLEGQQLRRLAKLVEDYMSCPDEQRIHTESIAAAYAGLCKKP